MLIRYLIINLLLISALFAGYFDTGYIQWEQPDGTKFTARLWGDEFENYMQTRDGHNIIIGKDECYYFAALSTDGIPVPTEKIVGIHEPDLQSYQLNQSAGIKTNPDQRAAFNEQLRLNGISYKQIKEKTTTGAVTINLGVILVDFTPSRRYKSDPHGNFPNGYQKHYFDELIFSENYWNGEPQAPLFETPHPENHALFGSLQDYYWQQSRGKLAL
ncbi:MAG: hypothetical protein GWN00_30195, partial [Aliifodinibius sp.]|nr:hypothetical protein [Fodinibius sp.]NIV15053.1 hypothetical protein [Fodinibius sp.]NIY28906.1 hypothetical protein [Fodinibius sp.]